MQTPLEKFQNLLRKLLQFEHADLDFGIYCIMNLRRDLMEKWLNEDLPKRAREILEQGGTTADDDEADWERLDLQRRPDAVQGAQLLAGDDAAEMNKILTPQKANHFMKNDKMVVERLKIGLLIKSEKEKPFGTLHRKLNNI